MPRTSVSGACLYYACISLSLTLVTVQYAGFNNPFIVTVILSCVQLISMLAVAVSTDRFGRRPLTVYPYAVTALSLLALGIVGCYDYQKSSLSSLLVSLLSFC